MLRDSLVLILSIKRAASPRSRFARCFCYNHIGEARCIRSFSVVSLDAYERTNIIVRVVVIARSQTTEEATHPIITPTKSDKSVKRPAWTVRTVYAIPPAVNQGYISRREICSTGWRTELRDCQNHDKSEEDEARRENLYPPREEYLDATRD